MSFLAPLGLLALLTLPAILLLHLMRERRRRVVVPSLLLYELLPRRQEAQRRRRLPLTLLLLLHLLVAALLSLALARPQWAVALLGGEEHLALIIDTSTSMAARARGVGAGSRLDVARERARALVSGLAGRGSITLIAAGTSASLIDRGGVDAISRLSLALDALAAGGTGSDIPGALTLAEAALEGLPSGRVVVLTDAASPTLADELADRTPALPVGWELVGDERDNRAIVTLAARPRGPGGPLQVYARAVNYAGGPAVTTLRLFVDDELADTRTLSFQPDGEVELTWALPAGAAALRAELDGADSLPADDSAALSLAASRPLRAVLVSINPAALERALRAVPGVDVAVIDPAAYPGSAEAAGDLTVFDGYLPDAWPQGGVLVVGPPAGSGLLDVGGRLRAPEDGGLRVAPGTTLLEGVSLSSVDFGQVAQIASPEWAATMLSRGDQPLMLRGRVGRSEIAIWTFDPAGGNLTSRLAFPLLMARSVRDLTPAALPGSALLGEALALRPDPRADSIVVRAPDGSEETLAVSPGERTLLTLRASGLYTVEELRGGEPLYTASLPVNAGTPAESDLAPRPLPSLPPAPAAAVGAERPEEAGRPLWIWLAAIALAVAMAEWLYVHGARRPGVSS
jgi:hypothetical protein